MQTLMIVDSTAITYENSIYATNSLIIDFLMAFHTKKIHVTSAANMTDFVLER